MVRHLRLEGVRIGRRQAGTVKLSRICPFCGRILLDQRLRINDLAVASGGENAAKLLNLTVPGRAVSEPENCQKALDMLKGNSYYLRISNHLPKEHTMTAKETEDLSLKTVTIEVNDHKVKMPDGPATGLEIKEAAIKQDVDIQLNFVLQVQLPNGSSKVVGDDDKVALTEHLAFTAIAADDNS